VFFVGYGIFIFVKTPGRVAIFWGCNQQLFSLLINLLVMLSIHCLVYKIPSQFLTGDVSKNVCCFQSKHRGYSDNYDTKQRNAGYPILPESFYLIYQ